jgi:hypothetical protein
LIDVITKCPICFQKNSAEKPSDPGDLLDFILKSVLEASSTVMMPSIESDSIFESFGTSSLPISLCRSTVVFKFFFFNIKAHRTFFVSCSISHWS